MTQKLNSKRGKEACFRNYTEVIATAKQKSYSKPTDDAVKAGKARQAVDDLQEQKRLAAELDGWL